MELPLKAGEAAAGRAPLPSRSPRGRPRSGRRRLSVDTPSHFLLVAYPAPAASAGGACPRLGEGSGWGGRVEARGSTTESAHIHPLPAVETCLAGLPGAPRPPSSLYLVDFAFVNSVQARS